MPPTKIETLEDVKAFIKYLNTNFGNGGFHPDDAFADDKLNELMDKSRYVARHNGADIYELCKGK